MIGLVALAAMGAGGCAGAHGAGAPSMASQPPDAPFAALGDSVHLVDVRPGRFAVTFDSQETTSCSVSWASDRSRSTVVMELGADGSALGCRGRRYDHSAGPNDRQGSRHEVRRIGSRAETVQTTKYVEQQGMRGRWRRDGRTILVDLDLDPNTCASRAEGTTPRPWHLRCAAIEPAEHDARIPSAALACVWRDPLRTDRADVVPWDITAGYLVRKLLPGEWLVLAPEAGVRLTYRPVGAGRHVHSDVAWLPASTPIPVDDWLRSSN